MSGSAGKPPPTVADAVRGLVALIVLAGLVAGVPAALWAIDGSPIPGSWPDIGEIWAVISGPDDGSFFLDVLLMAGWVGWATFAVSVFVEIPAAFHGMVAPRLPGLGAQQRLVAALIAAVAAVVPSAQIATAGIAVSAAGSVAETSGRYGPSEPAPPVTTDLLDEQRADDADGRGGEGPMTAGESWGAGGSYEVAPGDTLWAIAGSTLGDPRRHTEIFDASTQTIQPDGRRLTDPDLILPGWGLTIPSGTGSGVTDPTGVSPGTGPKAAGSSTPPADGRTAESPSDDEALTGAIGGAGVDDGRLAECDIGDGEASRAGHAAATDTGVTETDDERDLGGIVRTGGGLGAVLAVGLVGILAARRALWQRRRRAGQRLVPDAAVDRAAEMEIRQAADPVGVEFVDRALRTLAARLAGSDQSLPSLRAARLTRSALELYLAAPAEPPGPFVRAAQGQVWTVDVTDAGVLDAERATSYPAPYPSLVTVGHDSEDAHLLVDLEQLGSLTVDGPPDITQAVMTAVAAEFATSRWADDIRVTLVGDSAWADLHILDTGRVRQVADVDHLLDELTVRADDDRALLAQAGVHGLGAARVGQRAAATWTPEILLVADPLSAEQRRRLAAVIDGAPRLAMAAVIRGHAGHGGWALRVEGSLSEPTAVLDPLGIQIRPQLLDAGTYQDVVNLLRSPRTATIGQPRSEPDLREPPVLPTAGHRGFEPLLRERAPAVVAKRTVERNAPRLIMLGPVEVVNTAELGEPNKLGQLTELAMFVALNPGCDAQAVDDAIWPGSVVTKTTRNTAISKLRRWLGTDGRGAPLLPRTEGRYTFAPDVRSDWQDWCDLLAQGPSRTAIADLQAALALVKGRPFSGRGRRKYAWVDHHAQEMIAEIVDVCHELAVRSLSGGSPREALRSALVGLSIEPGVELLWRDRLRAEVMLGDRATVLASIDRLRETADDLGGDLDGDTEELIEQILRSGDRAGPA